MRRHFSPRMAVATYSVSLLVAPARSACANAGTAANRQPIETRARSINLSVSGSLRNDGRSFTDDALDLTILRSPAGVLTCLRYVVIRGVRLTAR